MAAAGRVKVGIIGSGFEADIHAKSFRILRRRRRSPQLLRCHSRGTRGNPWEHGRGACYNWRVNVANDR